MSLRTRLTVAVAVLVAGAIALTGWYLVDTAERELRQEVDSFLEARAEQLAPFDILGRVRGRGLPDQIAEGFGVGRFSEDDAIAQLITDDGTVVNLTGTLIPVSREDLAVTSSPGKKSIIKTVEIEGSDYRVLTVSAGRPGAALMVARDLDEVNGALDGLTRRTVVSGVVGAALAALAAWLMASRLSRPVHRLTEAAEHVAATQDLSASIDVDGTDEVGRLAASFNTMLEALDTSRQQQQRLVMDASHELRTPLTSLRTNIDLLQRARTIEESERGEVLADVSRELDHLSTLVAELVELSTSSRRPAEPVVEVDLYALSEEVAERARRRFGRPVAVQHSGDNRVQGHRSLLERAIWNLVDNAAKFSDEGAAIDVTVIDTRVAVRDRGSGIAHRDRDLVFDRFYRSVDTRSAPGSGLGLSIVSDIVDTHGGHCFVEDPEQGAGIVVGFDVTGV